MCHGRTGCPQSCFKNRWRRVCGRDDLVEKCMIGLKKKTERDREMNRKMWTFSALGSLQYAVIGNPSANEQASGQTNSASPLRFNTPEKAKILTTSLKTVGFRRGCGQTSQKFRRSNKTPVFPHYTHDHRISSRIQLLLSKNAPMGRRQKPLQRVGKSTRYRLYSHSSHESQAHNAAWQ